MPEIIEKNLKALFRIACPVPQMLGEFQLELLSPVSARPITYHLETCPHCQRELRSLTSYLPSPPHFELNASQPPISLQLKVLIAQLLPRPPAPVGIRGDQNDPQVYQAGGWQITVDIHTDERRLNQKSIFGLVLGDGRAREAQLWRENQLVSSATIDELGNFVFTKIMPGQYALIFWTDEEEIRIETLVI